MAKKPFAVNQPIIPADDPRQQAPQDPEDRHDPDTYDNDVKMNWLRGKGKRPGFDSGPSGNRYK